MESDADLPRHRIRQAVAGQPGLCIQEIARALGLDWSTVEYHLRILSRAGEVLEWRVGHRRVFFPPGSAPAEPSGLLSGAARRVLEALSLGPPASATDLARQLALARSGVVRHLGVLEEGGLVMRERSGKSYVYAPVNAPAETGPAAPGRTGGTG